MLLVLRDNKHGCSDVGVWMLALLSPAAAFVAATAAGFETIIAEFAAAAAWAAPFFAAATDNDNDDNDQE